MREPHEWGLGEVNSKCPQDNEGDPWQPKSITWTGSLTNGFRRTLQYRVVRSPPVAMIEATQKRAPWITPYCKGNNSLCLQLCLFMKIFSEENSGEEHNSLLTTSWKGWSNTTSQRYNSAKNGFARKEVWRLTISFWWSIKKVSSWKMVPWPNSKDLSRRRPTCLNSWLWNQDEKSMIVRPISKLVLLAEET